MSFVGLKFSYRKHTKFVLYLHTFLYACKYIICYTLDFFLIIIFLKNMGRHYTFFKVLEPVLPLIELGSH
jgi:hypothetical protein